MEIHTLLLKTTKEDNYFIGDKNEFSFFYGPEKKKKTQKIYKYRIKLILTIAVKKKKGKETSITSKHQQARLRQYSIFFTLYPDQQKGKNKQITIIQQK